MIEGVPRAVRREPRLAAGERGREPLVSVVVPCHNTEEYLEETLSSVVAQSYRNWELVFLENGSTDRSLEIARDFAARDPRIRVHVNDEFLGKVQNYNRVLELISEESRYTKILEADNWLYRDCLAQMVRVAESDSRVGVVCAYSMCETHLRLMGLPYSPEVWDGREIARRHFLEDVYLFGSPTTVLVRSDIVRSRRPFFDESTWLCEDVSAIFEILEDWDFGFVHEVLTFVRTWNEGSIQIGRQGLNMMPLHRTAVLLKNAPAFLEPDEFRAALRRTEGSHYLHLARALFQRRGDAFWDLHRSGLEEVGRPLSRWKLAQSVMAMALHRLLNPGFTLAAVWRRLIRLRG